MPCAVELQDVVIIGAGPAGAVAGAILSRKGRSVLCLERSFFPRHIIGESLLPRCNVLLERAGMLKAVETRNYMVKAAVLILRGERHERFSFAESLPGDAPNTFQVPRDEFDQLLAAETLRAGVRLSFGQQVENVEFGNGEAVVTVTDLEHGQPYEARARFVLDCSGYGRVLPRLLDLEVPGALPSRVACYTHVENDLRPAGEAEGDTWVCVHPVNGWIWFIPFSNGRTSVGMVCDHEYWDARSGSNQEKLFRYLREETNARARLAVAVPAAPTRTLQGYSSRVRALHGDGWALVGNAADFLDPVFSSGVTLAMEAGALAADLVDRDLSGTTPDWTREYDAVLRGAVGVFQAFVESWYSRELETIFFSQTQLPRVRRFVTSILGGNVLREDNPLLADARVGLAELAQAARAMTPVTDVRLDS